MQDKHSPRGDPGGGLCDLHDRRRQTVSDRTLRNGVRNPDALEIRIFAGADGQFDLYEDDGESYAYENGAICSTLFECRQDGKAVDIKVNPVEGTYEGIPDARNYSFEVRCTSKPRKVLVNGARTKDWTWEDNTLKVPAVKTGIRESANLKIQL